tara:strand:+ start:381 stop:641 length:261 start_codon:yes stop_codon:yes gene_type:complete
MKAQETLLDFLVEHYSDEAFLKADGFDSACIGFDYKTRRLIYSTSKCVNILVADGMDYEEACEYFQFNTLEAYVGEKTPIFSIDEW